MRQSDQTTNSERRLFEHKFVAQPVAPAYVKLPKIQTAEQRQQQFMKAVNNGKKKIITNKKGSFGKHTTLLGM